MRDRDRQEFERSALVHLPELLRFAVRLDGDVPQAEDLVQETFLQAWRSFGSFEPGTNGRAWLYKILLYVRSSVRRRKSRSAPLVHLDDVPEVGYEADSPDILTASAVKAAFDALPDPFRTAVLLADVHELTYKEIAETLDVPMGTVMSRLNRGRRLLRLQLRQEASAFGIGRASGQKGRSVRDA